MVGGRCGEGDGVGIRRSRRLRKEIEFGVLLEEGTSVGVGEEVVKVLAVCVEARGKTWARSETHRY